MRKTIQEQVDEYIETHPYLKKATSKQERLVLWLSHQPERFVIARFMAEADDERDAAIRNQVLDEVQRRVKNAIGTMLTRKGDFDYYTIGGVEAILQDMRK